jgi:hypothetical protein
MKKNLFYSLIALSLILAFGSCKEKKQEPQEKHVIDITDTKPMVTLLAHIEALKVCYLMIVIYLRLERVKVWKNIGKELVAMKVAKVTPMKKAMKKVMKKVMKLAKRKTDKIVNPIYPLRLGGITFYPLPIC